MSNPDLQPEEGDVLTVGFVYSPSWADGFSTTVDFWRVEALEPGRRLRLVAEMRLPGRAWLEFDVEESIEQLGVALELPPVALAELRPALDIVAVPPAKLGRRRDIPQPQIDRCRRLAHAAGP